MDFIRRFWVSPVFRQSRVVSGIILNKFGQGMVTGIVSTMIATMLAEDADFRITMEIASWLGPITGIGPMVTLPVSSYLMKKVGRRITYILMTIPVVIAMVMNACAYDVSTLLLGRFLCGITVGCTGVLAPMITGEFTSPHYRGTFLMLKTSFFNLGILLVHLLGYYMHWRVVSLVAATPFVVSILNTFTWPESPYWLAENDRLKESEEVFYWLRGRNRYSTREFEDIVENQRNKKKIMNNTFFENIREILMKFKKKNFWKPFVIMALTSTTMECGGRHVFPTYAILIIRDMTSTSNSVDSFYYNMATISIITVSAFTSAYLFKVFKLRPLLFITGFVAVVVLYLTSLFLYLTSNGTLSKEYSWIPISLLGLFFVVVNLACTLVPITIAGEIFPPEHRAAGAAVFGYFAALILIVGLKITPFLVTNFKTHGMFTVFASGLLLSLSGLYVLLPETKDKSLQEIDEFFTYGGRRERVSQRDANGRAACMLLPGTKDKSMQEVDEFFTYGGRRERVPQRDPDGRAACVLLPGTKDKSMQEVDEFFTYGGRRERVPQRDPDGRAAQQESQTT